MAAHEAEGATCTWELDLKDPSMGYKRFQAD